VTPWILVIDDEPVVRGLIVEMLESAGYLVESAETAEHALELLDREGLRLVLSDIVMPGLSGVELLRAVRLRRPNLPVVLVTGAGTYERLGQALLEGADALLLKPFSRDELDHAVAVVFERVAERERDYRVRFLRELGGPSSDSDGPARANGDPARPGRLSILLVEDDANHAELTTCALGRTLPDANVVRAPDVATAAKLSTGWSWSLAILDHHLPDGTGFDVLGDLRESSGELPILMLTGEGSEALAVEAFRRGATDYVVKTIGYEEELANRARRLVEAA
jgi:DNA-binding response OmpR family regulator